MSNEQIVDPYFSEKCRKHPEEHQRDLCAQITQARKKWEALREQEEGAFKKLMELVESCQHEKSETTTEQYTDEVGRSETVSTTKCGICSRIISQAAEPVRKPRLPQPTDNRT